MAFMFLVIGPVYRDTRDPTLAWQVGLFACFVNAVMEIAGAFGADWLRRNTPRAALAGIALTFIGMAFACQVFATPALAMIPAVIILAVYASKTRLSLGLPGGLVAVLTGVAIAWRLRAFGAAEHAAPVPAVPVGLYLPQPAVGSMLALMTSPLGWKYFAVIFPMGLLNIIASLQNLESAEAAGDRYET